MNTKKYINKVLQILLVALFVLPVIAKGQQVFDIKGAGARAAGMGYAFIGVADDATASSWNPGGLTQLSNIDISIVGDYMFNDKMVRSYYNDPSTDDLEFNLEEKFTLNYASVVVPIELDNFKKLAIGLSVQNYMNYLWAYDMQNSDYYYYSRYNNNMIYKGTLSLAYTLSNTISFGLSTNYYFSVGNELGGVYYNSPEDNYQRTYEGYSGLNFTAGILADFNESSLNIPLKLGVRVATPYELESDVTPEVFETGSLVDGWEMPLIAGVGVSYLFGENLTVSFDYDIRFLKDKNSYFYGTIYDYPYNANTNFPYDVDDYYMYDWSKEDGESPIVETNENLSQIRAGLEYNIPLGENSLPIRVGYKTNPTTEANVGTDGEISDLASGNSLHFGVGIQTPHFAFDVAYSQFSYTTTNETIYDGSDLYQYDYETSNSSIITSFILFLGRKDVKKSDDLGL